MQAEVLRPLPSVPLRALLLSATQLEEQALPQFWNAAPDISKAAPDIVGFRGAETRLKRAYSLKGGSSPVADAGRTRAEVARRHVERILSWIDRVEAAWHGVSRCRVVFVSTACCICVLATPSLWHIGVQKQPARFAPRRRGSVP